jgi:hypothetical protein
MMFLYILLCFAHVFVLLLLVFKEKNEDTKGVIRIRMSKKGRQHNVHN